MNAESAANKENKSEKLRYYFWNIFYCYSDAIFLYCIIRHFKPSRIVEIGSGFSSAVMLDTNDFSAMGQYNALLSNRILKD